MIDGGQESLVACHWPRARSDFERACAFTLFVRVCKTTEDFLSQALSLSQLGRGDLGVGYCPATNIYLATACISSNRFRDIEDCSHLSELVAPSPVSLLKTAIESKSKAVSTNSCYQHTSTLFLVNGYNPRGSSHGSPNTRHRLLEAEQ